MMDEWAVAGLVENTQVVAEEASTICERVTVEESSKESTSTKVSNKGGKRIMMQMIQTNYPSGKKVLTVDKSDEMEANVSKKRKTVFVASVLRDSSVERDISEMPEWERLEPESDPKRSHLRLFLLEKKCMRDLLRSDQRRLGHCNISTGFDLYSERTYRNMCKVNAKL